MRRIFIIFVTIAMILVFFTACQATPEKPVVIQKDMEQMIEKAMDGGSENKPIDEVKTLEKYQTTISSNKGDIDVIVDAKIVFPEQNNIPLCRVKRNTFSQELIDKMIGGLLRGNTLHEKLEEVTKSEILAYLEALYKMKDNGEPLVFDGDYDDPKAELDRRIAEYQDMLADAPESRMGNEITTELKVIDSQGGDYSKGVSGCTEINGKNANLRVIESSSNSEIHFSITDSLTQYPFFYALNKLSTDPYPDLNCGLTQEQAEEVADKFLSSLGIKGMICVEAAEGFSSDFHTIDNKPFSKGYYLKYSRSVNGIPIIMETGGGSSNDYIKPWAPERMSFIVDDSGIISFIWESPYTVPEIVSEDSKIKPVEEIKNVFEKMIIIINDWVNADGGMNNHLTIDIDKMELGMIRVVSQDSEDEGLLIPAWVFYGKKTYKGSAGGILPNYEPQIIINSIDGSVVDRSLGY